MLTVLETDYNFTPVIENLQLQCWRLFAFSNRTLTLRNRLPRYLYRSTEAYVGLREAVVSRFDHIGHISG